MRANPSTEREGKSVKKEYTRVSKQERDIGLKTAEENGDNESIHHLPGNQPSLYKS